jgi:pimeloyl-ACP methyl ester carboxylesterase
MTMSRLLLLPGNHPSQRGWIRAVEAALRDLFGAGQILEYTHWDDPDTSTIDFEKELGRLSAAVGDDQDWIVFAKSAGVMLGLMAVQRRLLSPQAAVLVGTPLTWARGYQIDMGPWVSSLAGYALYVQQESDPTGSAAELDAVLSDCQGCRYDLVVVPGEDHDYDVDQVRTIISRHLENLLGE